MGKNEGVENLKNLRDILEGYTAGLEKYLNSTLPVGQVNLKFCLPGALPHLSEFSNSLIIHEPKNGSQTTGIVLLVLITFLFTPLYCNTVQL